MGNSKLHGVWDDTTRVWSRLYIAREYVFGTILYTQCSSTGHAHPSPRHCRTKLRQRRSRRQSAKIHPFVRTHIYIFDIVKRTQTAKTTTKFKGGEASCSMHMNVFLPLTFSVIREWWRCSQIAMQTNMHAVSSQPSETIWQMPSLFLRTSHYRVTDWRVMDWRADWRALAIIYSFKIKTHWDIPTRDWDIPTPGYETVVNYCVRVRVSTRTQISRAHKSLEHSFFAPKLSSTHFSHTNFSRTQISRAFISLAPISRVSISRAPISHTPISRALVTRTQISLAHKSLEHSFLAHQSLVYQSLAHQSLEHYFSHTNFSRAQISQAFISLAPISCVSISRAHISLLPISRALITRTQISLTHQSLVFQSLAHQSLEH